MDPTTSQRARAPAPESLFDLARGVLRDLPALLSDRVELFALEMQRAGRTLVKMVALTVVAAILGVTAWLAAWSLLVGLLVAAGWHWAAANGLVLLINIGAASWAVWRVRRLMSDLGLPHTRNHLTLGSITHRQAHTEPEPLEHEQHRAHTERPAAAA